MRAEEVIWTKQVITPMIYAYTTPGYPKNDGWTKIGYTEQGGEEAHRAADTYRWARL